MTIAMNLFTFALYLEKCSILCLAELLKKLYFYFYFFWVLKSKKRFLNVIVSKWISNYGPPLTLFKSNYTLMRIRGEKAAVNIRMLTVINRLYIYKITSFYIKI
jgi:hypothetical protein